MKRLIVRENVLLIRFENCQYQIVLPNKAIILLMNYQFQSEQATSISYWLRMFRICSRSACCEDGFTFPYFFFQINQRLQDHKLIEKQYFDKLHLHPHISTQICFYSFTFTFCQLWSKCYSNLQYLSIQYVHRREISICDRFIQVTDALCFLSINGTHIAPSYPLIAQQVQQYPHNKVIDPSTILFDQGWTDIIFIFDKPFFILSMQLPLGLQLLAVFLKDV